MGGVSKAGTLALRVGVNLIMLCENTTKWYSRKILIKQCAGKKGGAESECQGDSLFFWTFPAHKNGGGDKGVGVETRHTLREHH